MSNKPRSRDKIYTIALVLSGLILLTGLALIVIGVTIPEFNSMLPSGVIAAIVGVAGIALVIWYSGKPTVPPRVPPQAETAHDSE